MASHISEADQIASLDDDEVPFEAPAGRAASPRPRIRKKQRASFIGLFAIVYALGAVGIGAIDHGGFYLFAWLVTGPLLFGIVRTFRPRAEGVSRS